MDATRKSFWSTVRRVQGLEILFAILALLVVFDSTPALSEDFPRGSVIERVICKDKAEQSYALYLPSNYSPDRSWPLIAAFDPGARGKMPVERFRQAAEQYGYIVCGSNNSRNGPWAPTAEAAQAMLRDVSQRFAVDDKRLYLTGFSGGARVATRIALSLRDNVAGVIGCGAGLSTGLQPSALAPFAYYGTVGTEDFNYPEMKQLERSFESTTVAHHLEVFEGGHDWAPADSCVRAIEWMIIQGMKSGKLAVDRVVAERLLKNAVERARAQESAGRGYDAYTAFSAIASDFKGLLDTAEYEARAAALRDSAAVKDAIKQERDDETEQRRRATELFRLRAALRTSPAEHTTDESPVFPPDTQESPGADRQLALSDLKKRLADLKRKSDLPTATRERALAGRVLNQFLIAEFESASGLIQSNKYDPAIAILSIDTELMPDNWRFFYNLACVYSLKGDRKRALSALDKAVEKGFTNAAELETNKQLIGIRDESEFKALVNRLKQPR